MKKDCDFIKDGKHIASAGNGRRKWHSVGKFLEKKDKYPVPEKLCLAILKRMEQLIATPSYSSEANASSSANAESLIGIPTLCGFAQIQDFAQRRLKQNVVKCKKTK